MNIFKNIYCGVLVSFAFAATLTSCQDTDYPVAQPATGASTLSANALFINAAPDAPALNFFVNNLAAGGTIAPGAGTAYNVVAVGPIELRAKAASGSIGGILGSADVLFRAGATNNTNFTAAPATNYTFFVTDSLNRPKATTLGATDPGGPRFLQVADALTAPTAGNAGVRFYNLSTNSAAVWVNLVASGKTTTPFTNKAYRASVPAFSNVPAGTYTVEIRYTSATGKMQASVDKITLADGKIYTMYASGLVGGTGSKAMTVGVAAHN